MAGSAIEYIPIGGINGIGASAHYLRLDQWGILLDTGLDPQRNGQEALPEFHRLSGLPLHAIIISHAHLDHLGSLPVAIKYFPHARVYMTEATVRLADRLLFHYLRVQKKRRGTAEPALYDEQFLESIQFLFQGFGYNHPFPLHGAEESGIRLSFLDAGHILGSAGVLIEWQGRRIFYTGNTRLSPQFIMKGATYPEPRIDLLISEATYGANEGAEQVVRRTEISRFARRLGETLTLGGIVLIPVFALGRTQEMMTLIHQLLVKNRIPAAPMYVTGLGRKINRLYDQSLQKDRAENDYARLGAMSFGAWPAGRILRGPAIMIATSGMMMPGTRSHALAKELLAGPRNAICFVGYSDPETPAGLLRESRAGQICAAFSVDRVLSTIDRFHFSAHSNRLELLKMAEMMRPRKLFFVHGDADALQWMAEASRRLLPNCDVNIPRIGECYKM